MNDWQPSFEPDNYSEYVQKLVERFRCAGWITGDNLVTRKGFLFHFTPKAKARILAVTAAWREARPDLFEKSGQDAVAKAPLEQFGQEDKMYLVYDELDKVSKELSPSPLIFEEKQTLSLLLLRLALDGFSGDGPDLEIPNRG